MAQDESPHGLKPEFDQMGQRFHFEGKKASESRAERYLSYPGGSASAICSGEFGPRSLVSWHPQITKH